MITKKLEILKESNVIDEETKQFVLSITTYLIENNVIFNAEQADMFLTHVAMANMRQKKNESIGKMEEIIYSELKKDINWEVAKKLWQKLQHFSSTDFNEDERKFIYMHLINILNRDK